MQISISNVIGRAISLGSYVSKLIKAFKARVAVDIGIFEAELCLSTTLKSLNTIGLLDKTSLCITPNAYKESILYSVVPNTTLGDMTVVRATTATRVNSAGLIESVGLNIPRIDYTNGSCPSLLVEPQRTNLLTYSNDYSNGIWTIQAGTSITPNNAISPDGLMNATKVISNGSNGIYQAPVIVSTTVNNTKSIYLKGVIGGETVLLRDPWQSINTTTCILTTEWQRFTLSETQSGGEAGLWIKNVPSTGIYIYGAQLEVGSYPTSYIPTVATSVTRNADVISKTGISSLIGQTEGTLFVDLKSAYNGWVTLSDNSDANGVLLYFSKEYSTLNYFIYANSVDIIGTGYVDLPSEPMKLAFKYKSGEIKLFVNGVLAYTNTATFAFSNNLSFFGNRLYWGGGLFEGSINSEQLYKTALTDAECINLTTL